MEIGGFGLSFGLLFEMLRRGDRISQACAGIGRLELRKCIHWFFVGFEMGSTDSYLYLFG